MFSDSGHRDHAKHFGEYPRNEWSRGPYGLTVTLDQWGPWDPAVMYHFLQANWGDDPDRSDWENEANIKTYVEKCFAGQTLQQILEGISFWFTIDGVCRPATHQIVRSRHAAFMQHGGRDNDWRHRRWSMPETIWRAIRHLREHFNWTGEWLPPELKSAVDDVWPLSRYLQETGHDDLERAILAHLQQAKNLYAALVDAGIPWQDARRLLPMGTQTYIHAIYNFVSLRDFLSNRLEHVMDWEINCIAQLMVREVKIHCPPVMASVLKSHSDRRQTAAFAGLESWTPDGKWPVDPQFADRERTHRAEQNPFFILHPDSMRGGPVEWIPTNGQWPEEMSK